MRTLSDPHHLGVQVRPATRADVPGIVRLQKLCFPDPFPEELLWQPKHIESHLRLFAAGQWVAVMGDKVVGSATNMLVERPDWNAHLPWETITGGLHLTNHRARGGVLYGIDISVAPNVRGKGIAKMLYAARFEYVRSNRLWGYGTVCRLPGLLASGLSAEEYANDVAKGKRIDPTLTPLLKQGLSYRGLIEGYMEDEESLNCGAILEWRP